MDMQAAVAPDLLPGGPSSSMAARAETEAAPGVSSFHASVPLGSFSRPDASSGTPRLQPLDLLTEERSEGLQTTEADAVGQALGSTDERDGAASAATAQVYEQKMQEMKAQIDDLWSQKEAFRRANERITRILTQLQQHEPQAAADLNAAAAEAVRSARGNPGSVTHRLLLRSPRDPSSGISDAYPSGRVTTTGDSGSRRRGSVSSARLPRSQSVTLRSGRESQQLRAAPVPRLDLQGPSLQKGGATSSRTPSGQHPEPVESYRGSRVRPTERLMRYRAENSRGSEELTHDCHLKREGSIDSRKKGHQLPPLPLRSGLAGSTGSREGMRPAKVRSASQNATPGRIPRLDSAGFSALPPLPTNGRRSLQFGQGLMSARSRSGSGSAMPLTARPSLAETALRTPRRCFLDDGIVCVSKPSGSSPAEGSPLGSPLGIAAAPIDFAALPGAGSQCDGGGILAGLEEHLAASVRQALETLQHVENGGNPGVSNSASAAALVAAGAAGGAMSCVQKPTDGYWHVMYTCVIKIRGTDFFLNVRCGDEGPRNGRLIATKEQAGIFKVCVRHLLRGARDMYDAWKVFWWHPMPVILVEELLPLDEVLRRRAEERLQQLKKKSKKRRNKKKKKSKSSPVANSSSTERLPEATTTGSRTEDSSASRSPSKSGRLSRANSCGSLTKRGASSSGQSSSGDDVDSGTVTAVQSGSDSEKSRKSGHRPDYSEWDALALMYIGSLDAEAPVCQFKGVDSRQLSRDEGWYVSNSRAAVVNGGNSSPASGYAGISEGAKADSGRSERRRGSSSLADLVSARTDSAAGAFDRACQLCLSNKLSLHEIFIVRRGDRERGCFPLYHRAARRYLYAHQTNGLVGMISARSTPEAAAAARAVRLAVNKRLSEKNGENAASNAEEADTEAKPLLESDPAGLNDESQTKSQDPTAPQMFTPSQFELVALSDLMVQQTVAQILAALPAPESPLAHNDDYDLDSIVGEEELYEGSPPTTVSSDEADFGFCPETPGASPSMSSSDEACQDRISSAASGDLTQDFSGDCMLLEPSLAPCSSPTHAGSAQDPGSVRTRPAGVPSLQLAGAVLGLPVDRRTSQSSRAARQRANKGRASQPIQTPVGCDQFLLEDLDAETDLEEAANGEALTPHEGEPQSAA
ncbi:hypothetical protein CSUI_000171 [Cystoisospora suis]|uniref:Uncharacterized protein n=1 Tax=Cystoisospora suis TaxID=483139 RepID=A0A2C6LHJ6_9APIC|nr:hypothetical protein CSUI_000171 [Cystoisospora suis]